MMDMAPDNAVVPEETLRMVSHVPPVDARRNPQTTWADDVDHVSSSRDTSVPIRSSPPASSQAKGSLRGLIHQMTKLFLHPDENEVDPAKRKAHYRRGSILMKHLEEKKAKGKATEKDMKFFEMVKGHFDANIMESRTIISLSVFQTGSNPMNDPFAVIHMPVIIQQGFRRKLFAIFSLQLFAVVTLICIFSYPAPIVAAFKPIFSKWHFVFVAFLVMVVALLWLYLVKYKFPINFLVLTVYTITQSIFFTGCDYLFETKASIFIFSFLFCIMAMTTALCTMITKKARDENTPPVLISYPVVILVGFILAFISSLFVYFLYMQDVVSTIQYCGSLGAMLLLVMWFAYDASCMNERLSPDEYMQGMVFFYTDMVLFLLFLSIIFVACFACEGDCACYGTADIAPIGTAGGVDEEGEEDEEGEGDMLDGDENGQ
ncbi:hypothetical protein Gpo141_00012340 [Globisporangium polare]